MNHENLQGQGAQAAEGRVYEIREFVTLGSAAGYVKVRHSRTIFDEQGRVRQEQLPVESSVEHLIRAFDGRSSHSQGAIIGDFESPERARECAANIERHFAKPVELTGTRLSVSL